MVAWRVPSTYSSTFKMPEPPTLSATEVVTEVVPVTVAPAVGEDMLAVGAPLSTVTGIDEEVVELLAASLAMAVRVWLPLVAPVVFQVME